MGLPSVWFWWWREAEQRRHLQDRVRPHWPDWAGRGPGEQGEAGDREGIFTTFNISPPTALLYRGKLSGMYWRRPTSMARVSSPWWNLSSWWLNHMTSKTISVSNSECKEECWIIIIFHSLWYPLYMTRTRPILWLYLWPVSSWFVPFCRGNCSFYCTFCHKLTKNKMSTNFTFSSLPIWHLIF